MATIQIYEHDQATGFAADADWAVNNGGKLERIVLGDAPLTEVSAVREFIEQHGVAGLPLCLVDGAVKLHGRYPTREELMEWMGWKRLSLTDESPFFSRCDIFGCG